MNKKIYHEYTMLSQQLLETYACFMQASMNDRERLWDEFWELRESIRNLVKQEPELGGIFTAMLQEHSIERCHMMTLHLYTIENDDLLEELQAFADGKPITFTNRNLYALMRQYETCPAFQKMCHVNPAIWKAFLYWQAEYHRRMENDEVFAAWVLRSKIVSISMNFSFSGDSEISEIPVSSEGSECTCTKIMMDDGTVEFRPVKLNDTELELLYRLYHTSPECRKIFDDDPENRSLHNVIAYFLQEYQHKTSEQ